MEKEPPWSTALTTSLRVAFGLLLLTLALIAFSQILLSILGRIADEGERGAWIGFWGNVVGGSIGLVGGLIAAVAAVYAVRQQLSEQRRIEAQASSNATDEFVRLLLGGAQNQIRLFRLIFNLVDEGKISQAAGNLKTICEIFPPVSDGILSVIALRDAAAALHISTVQRRIAEAEKVVKKADAWKRTNPKNSNPLEDAVAAFHARKLVMNGLLIALSISYFKRSLGKERSKYFDGFIAYEKEINEVCVLGNQVADKYAPIVKASPLSRSFQE